MTDIQQKPFLIDSVIGNGRILACLMQSGELVRAFWPTIDYAQHINKTEVALRVNGAADLHLLHSSAFAHQQRYVPDTNVVETTYRSSQLPLAITSYDFAATELDVIVRQYLVTNSGEEELEVDLLYLTDFHMEESPIYQSVLYDNEAHAIGHYRRSYWALIGGDERPFGFQVGNVANHLHLRRLNGYQGATAALGSEAAQVFTAKVQPGETVEFPIYIAFGHNRAEAGAALASAREIGATDLRVEAEQTAHAYLARGRQVKTGHESLDIMYRRSLLVFSLMADAVHGGLIAAPEFDPFFTRCGGYGYCWGRDAGYITTAIDRAGYFEIGRKFYEWAMNAQEADGSWDHRHYMNGELAPSWGYQADEPASILWGMWQHFVITGDREFLQTCWPSMERGANHLLTTLADNGLPQASMDLWEERFAQHTYSSGAVAASLLAVGEAAKELGYAEKADSYLAAGEQIRRIVEELFNESKQSWYRGLNLYISPEQYKARQEAGESVRVVQDEHGYDRYVADYDTIVDASLLGLSYPFALFDAKHPAVLATAEAVRELCTQKGVGGIRRYEDDIYAGGNPWVLCSLWLALDANRRGDAATVQEVLEWVLDNQSRTGLLPEQVHKVHGGPGWILPLTWSHAMFVLTVLEHYGQ